MGANITFELCVVRVDYFAFTGYFVTFIGTMIFKTIKINYFWIVLLLLVFSKQSNAQLQRVSEVKSLQLLTEIDTLAYRYNTHTTLTPFYLPTQFDTSKKAQFSLMLSPLFHLTAQYNTNDASGIGYDLGVGARLKVTTNKKWLVQFDYLRNNFAYKGYQNAHIISTKEAYGFGYADSSRQTTNYFQGFIAYKPNKIFTFECGMGNQFIGEGYRSLLLADNAYSYPYLKISTKIWKIKYDNIYSNWWDIRFSNGNFNYFMDKYATTHYLSFFPIKWLNVGFFETIVFSAQDGNFYRGFDLNYLNPVIFYRPVEYSAGSSDNALMGLTLKTIIKQKYVLYSQFLIDEFLLDEIRAGNGWWANKFAIQLGAKAHSLFGVTGFSALSEINIIRPFTYSYFERTPGKSALINYGHFNASMAHPAGANLAEGVVRFSYKKNNWLFTFNNNYIVQGVDTAGENLGADIYKSYDSRTNDYGNKLLQGERKITLVSTFNVFYAFTQNKSLVAHFSVSNYHLEKGAERSNQVLLKIGVKTLLRNRYMDY